MIEPIIKPSMFNLPKLTEKIILFFSLRHFYLFRELVGGSKVKSFGPSKRFTWELNKVPVTAVGGMIGAPLAAIAVENAAASGGRRFFSFGSAGWIGENEREIGELTIPENGMDETGISENYGSDTIFTSFDRRHDVTPCSGIVSVNSFYRLTVEKVKAYRSRQVELIDMEASPLNYVVSCLDGTYCPLFIISDRVESGFQWQNGSESAAFERGLEKGLKLLTSI
ncbi:MAG: nucleoside phosphorylase [Proteobacteria bacterium]|nr:nucleoside phosphorylase [Pseudomonadota bacterium]